MTQLADLLLEQEALQHEFIQDQLIIQSHLTTPVTAGTAALLKSRMEVWYPKLDTLRTKLLKKVKGTGDHDTVAQGLSTLQRSWTRSMGQLLDIISIQNHRQPPQQQPPNPVSPMGKLPDLAVPTFTGNLQDWIPFADMFKSVVHTNARLSNVARFQYLKAALKDEPLQLIAALPVTDTNYTRAWQLLEGRYQNTRKLVSFLVSQLLHLPSVPSGSPKDLRKLVDTSVEIIQQLRDLQQPVDQWDAITTTLLGEKIDNESNRAWKRTLNQAIPELVGMTKFLNDRIDADLDHADTPKKKTPPAQSAGKKKAYSNLAASESPGSPVPKCPVCDDAHKIFYCKTFLSKTTADRHTLVNKTRLCVNCLAAGHPSSKCPSKVNCHKCSLRHHTMLHPTDQQSPTGPPAEGAAGQTALHISNVENCKSTTFNTLLATAIVHVKDPQGNYHPVRALLDGGSQVSCITNACATRLNLIRESTRINIYGLQATPTGGSNEVAHLTVTSTVKSEQPPTLVPVAAVILPKITGKHPTTQVDPNTFTHLKGLQLADPHFAQPSSIDILLGADAYPEITRDGKIKGPKGTPTAFNTIFGWTLMGKIHSGAASVYSHYSAVSSLDTTLQRFWQLEELTTKVQSPEEKECRRHFQSTHARSTDGRYIVRLPFNSSNQELGRSRTTAIRRWVQQEARLMKNPRKCSQYHDFMQTMLDMGHMKRVPPHQQLEDGPSSYYIPHHAVINEASTSTKLRVVFDASAKASNGVSLNDKLMVGPWVQDELLDHLLRFRLHHIVLVADIVKMFRQVAVHPDDWNYQRVIWRPKVTSPLVAYWLTTVVYGQAGSPFLATQTLNQLAVDEASKFPEASQCVLRDFYVDNLIGGTRSTESALKLVSELNQLLEGGQLPLKKWMSNSEAVLQHIPVDCRETESLLNIEDDDTMKTLGLQWHPKSDDFCFVLLQPEEPPSTKRAILSDIAKVFDPLGWMSPITVTAKVLMQKLWAEQLDWDSQLPPSLQEQWKKYRSSLSNIQALRIPRCVLPPSSSSFTLHGFCDASEKAYAAAIYIWTADSTPHLLIAKTKVAPTKKTTLPRLELCGALLLSKLMAVVTSSLHKLDHKIDDTFAWTDSTIVLAWLSSNANRWSTFVGNRVAQIQEVIPASKWNHVRSHDNPADAASRGITPAELTSSELWWHGPPWLPTVDMQEVLHQPTTTNEEEKKSCNLLAATTKCPTTNFLQSFSLLSKLLRVTVYIRRKLHKRPRDGHPSAQEFQDALRVWIKQEQRIALSPDIEKLRSGGSVATNSKLVSLHPFVDHDGLVRVNGRIQRAPVSVDQRQPILLPKDSHLTKLLIQREHHRLLHAGPQQVRASLQLQYWIPTGQATIRNITRRCITCAKAKAATLQQLMGDLPSQRVTPSPPFTNTGVDYAGPFELKVQKLRGQAKYKAYACIFVCLSTKAVHLELVSDLTTEGFLGALQRFTSQRGNPTEIASDNGTNFQGAANTLKAWYDLILDPKTSEAVSRHLSERGITWRFIPPNAPHMGGLWEAAVKSMKFHLKRIMGEESLTYENFGTVLKRVEATLNSRPLCPASTDIRDPEPLTPAHFLIGRALTSWPEPDITTLNTSRLNQWQRVQQLSQHFWSRWSREYLSSLQARPKGWNKEKDNLAVGDLVIIKQDNLAALQWKMGRVTETHQGKDGLVRVVTLRTSDGKSIQRPIVKLCHLPVEPNSHLADPA